MREPPYDDELVPALMMLICVLVFAIFLVWLIYLNRDVADFVPPSSTLPPLEA